MAGLVQRRRAAALPRARRRRSLGPRADRPARGGRAVARSRRRGNARRSRSSDGSATIEPWVATLRAHMMPDGVEQALADADLALDQLPAGQRLAADRAPLREASRTRCSAQPIARRTTSTASRRDGAWRRARPRRSIVAQAQLALLAAKRGAWGEAGRRARAAQAARRGGGPRRLLVERARARGDGARRTSRGAGTEDARAALTRAHRLRPHARPRHSRG